uniref:Uncharacterized protein n=1 Tax=Romanomermis culicivorax TaxID=13658 RepID=A0A915IP76_ROMCU
MIGHVTGLGGQRAGWQRHVDLLSKGILDGAGAVPPLANVGPNNKTKTGNKTLEMLNDAGARTCKNNINKC